MKKDMIYSTHRFVVIYFFFAVYKQRTQTKMSVHYEVKNIIMVDKWKVSKVVMLGLVRLSFF